jgi:hypothetical protein
VRYKIAAFAAGQPAWVLPRGSSEMPRLRAAP